MNNKTTAKKKNIIDKTFGNLVKSDSFGGILLILSTLAALFLANSQWKDAYHHLLHVPIGIEIGHNIYEMSFLHIVNDILMAVFFYLIGLEIKREIVDGELSSIRKATLPALGAVGGMVIPALIYVAFIFPTGNPEALGGWGVPMATDIAFSLGILSLLGKRVPLTLKVFLVALAIVDDLGAILVIALFYTSDLQLGYLVAGLAIVAGLFILNRLNYRRISVYHIAGLIVWYCIYRSGIHATIAGVLVAFTIPISRELNVLDFRKRINSLVLSDKGDTKNTLTIDQIHNLSYFKKQIDLIQSPVQKLEHTLHDFANYIIMPIFAFSNAGVTFEADSNPFSIVTIAVIVALVVGKPVGITLFAWIGCKFKIAELPTNIKWVQLFAVAILGGLGFTMSLFIAHLAFTDHTLQSQAKVGILIGSIIAGLAGYFILKSLFSNKKCNS